MSSSLKSQMTCENYPQTQHSEFSVNCLILSLVMPNTVLKVLAFPTGSIKTKSVTYVARTCDITVLINNVLYFKKYCVLKEIS